MPVRKTPPLAPSALLVLVGLLLAGCRQAPADGPAEAPAAPGPSLANHPAAPEKPPQVPGLPVQVPAPSAEASGTMTAWFFDVGQGDATLLAGPDFMILIDAGRHDRQDVVPHLKRAGVQSVDLLIGTHPHADHIGQFPQVLKAFPVAEVWMSGDAHTTRTFERALDAILASEAGYHEPRAGEVRQIGSARIEVLNPPRLTGDLHEGCLGLRVTFGEVALLFTGDAEAQTESAMIARRHVLTSQILQLGHHGSRTSSSPAFLQRVAPQIAVYSAGEGNSYGHPHQEVVQRLARLGVPLYGTPEHGTIRIASDGRSWQVELERQPPIRGPPQPAADQGPAPGKVNVNTAPPEELVKIIHIGPERAAELVRLRPFRRLEGLTRIRGIGPARLRDIQAQGVACAD